MFFLVVQCGAAGPRTRSAFGTWAHRRRRKEETHHDEPTDTWGTLKGPASPIACVCSSPRNPEEAHPHLETPRTGHRICGPSHRAPLREPQNPEPPVHPRRPPPALSQGDWLLFLWYFCFIACLLSCEAPKPQIKCGNNWLTNPRISVCFSLRQHPHPSCPRGRQCACARLKTSSYSCPGFSYCVCARVCVCVCVCVCVHAYVHVRE